MASNVLSASRAGTGSVVVTTTSASITAQIVGVGTVAMPVAAPPPTARQYAVTVNSS